MNHEPSSFRVDANGLSLHALEWEGPRNKTVVMVHGYLDHSASFVPMATALSRAGYRVVCPDMRGHGRSEWVRTGGYYYFPDYVADLDAFLEAVCPLESVPSFSIVGHSMGGGISTLYAGTRASRVNALVLMEGLGPPHMHTDIAVARMERWLDGVRLPRVRQRRKMATRDDVVSRLRMSHGDTVPLDVLQRVSEHLTESAQDGDGWVWRFDPLHQTVSPTLYDENVYQQFASRVECPVLLVDGGSNGMHFPGVEKRFAWFRSHTRATFEGTGHMMHWTAPDVVSERVIAFLESSVSV